MGEGHRLLGYIRGGGDMRVGSLVKHIEYGFIGIITKHHCKDWLVVWTDNVWNGYCSECELEVLCV